MPSKLDTHPIPTSTVTDWDLEADVVIAGYGIAGVAAAIEAARAGASVLIIERTGGWGGAASLSGGFIYLGGGTPLQKALGFDDTPENMEAFMLAAFGPGVDEAKVHAYAAESLEHYQWLVDQGVVFKEEFWGEPGWEPPADHGLMYSGGENSAPFNKIATPAPRGHLPQMENKRTGEQGGGYMLMKPLVAVAEGLGVTAEFDIRLQTLVVGDTGRVEGLVAKRYGKQLHIRAHRGVVLATGSFAYNDAMIKAFTPRLLGRPAAAIEEHDGTGILAAQALGASVVHMDAAEVAMMVDPQFLPRGILVNRHGQRYIPEDTYPGIVAQATLSGQDNIAYLIIDEQALEDATTSRSSAALMRTPPTWVAESVEELEKEIGLPEGTLQATISAYNATARDGQDPLFGKKAEWLRPITAPLAGFDFTNKTGGFPLGGLATDLESRVLHVSGEPIPGLFAAGRCTSGISAGGYASGASLGDSSFFGRRAGSSAAE